VLRHAGIPGSHQIPRADPKTYFVTDHYRGYPTVLVRLPRVRTAELRSLIDVAWRRIAPKRLMAEFDRRP